MEERHSVDSWLCLKQLLQIHSSRHTNQELAEMDAIELLTHQL